MTVSLPGISGAASHMQNSGLPILASEKEIEMMHGLVEWRGIVYLKW